MRSRRRCSSFVVVSLLPKAGLEKKAAKSSSLRISQFLLLVSDMSTASSISGGGGGVTSGGGSHDGGGTGNDTKSTRGRSRRSFKRRDGPQATQSFCQDSNLPGSKPRLGTVGRQLSQATYVKSFSQVGV